MNHDFGQGEIKQLKREIAQLKKVAEELVVTAFAICEIRDLWRVKFGLPKKCVDVKDENKNDILPLQAIKYGGKYYTKNEFIELMKKDNGDMN